MTFKETSIPGLILVEPKVFRDYRGYFLESFNRKTFSEAGIIAEFVQDNQSLSNRGTLRGLHGQADPFAQGKLVRVIQGRVIDIAVDIRKNSSTYGQHVSVELTGDNFKMLWIPPGFLHGFSTLEDNTIFTYKVTNLYDRTSEIGVKWNDPDLNIDWGIGENEAILSDKDQILPLFKDFKSPF
jgi:dTDP-4-dehydrorhamnose 3,5-epimerase